MRGLLGSIGYAAAAVALLDVDHAIERAPLARWTPPYPVYRGSHRNRTTYFTEGLNGKRAIARRLRQIVAGSLRVENGLVL